MNETKIIYLRRKVIAAGACALAAVMMFWVVNHPAVVGASAATRQLPIYCVQKDYKVLSISFDAAWGDAILRHVLPDRKLPSIFKFQVYIITMKRMKSSRLQALF